MNPKSFKIRSFVFGVMMFMAGGYFAIHGLGLGGDNGYLSIGSLDEDILSAEQELIALQDHRKWLEHVCPWSMNLRLMLICWVNWLAVKVGSMPRMRLLLILTNLG